MAMKEAQRHQLHLTICLEKEGIFIDIKELLLISFRWVMVLWLLSYHEIHTEDSLMKYDMRDLL